MLDVPVVMLVAAAAVLAGVIAVALGRGGELAFFPADYAPVKLDEIAATDVVLFRPPLALWGYNTQATDEALNRIAEALTERDIEITALRQKVANLESAPPAGRPRGYRLSGRPDRAHPPGPPPGGPGLRDVRPSGAPGPRSQDGPAPGPVPSLRDTRPLQAGERPPRAGERALQAGGPVPFGPDDERPPPGQSPAAGDAERFGLGGAAGAGQPPPGDPPPGAPDAPAADPPRAPAGEEEGW